MRMGNGWYIFYILVLGLLSFVTGEIVTFIMLGFVLVSLNNINETLKKMYKLHRDNSTE
ncbi:hypothetical protein [Virgibacillus ainsalahensis]